MKKKFFVFVLFVLIISTGTISGQVAAGVSHTEIANSIEKAKVINRGMSGIENPDSIYPGQFVWVSVPVKKGDTQWAIHRDELSKGTEGEVLGNISSGESEEIKEDSSSDMSWLMWLFLALVLLLLLAYIFYLSWYRNIDPVTAGRPQVQGGVTSAGAHTRIREIAENRFPGSSISDIKNIRRGTLSGRAIVFYEGKEKPKRINLHKTPAYAGEITVNDKDQTIYFLQGCGNDARRGDYFTGNDLIFTTEVLINQDGKEVPISTDNNSDLVNKTEKENSVSAKTNKSEPLSSDEVLISREHAIVADEFLKTQKAHRVTMDYTKNADGSFTIKSVFETKNLSDIKDKKKN